MNARLVSAGSLPLGRKRHIRFISLSFIALSCRCSMAGKKARALYACKAEHDSELSFIAGTIFENGESGFEGIKVLKASKPFPLLFVFIQ